MGLICNPCGVFIGSIAMPPDGGADADAAIPDSGSDADAALACGTGVCGTIAMPTDAAPDGPSDGSPDQ